MSEAKKRPEVEPEMRRLRDGEALCKFGCRTIIDTRSADGLQGHCGMCCEKANKARAKRVDPINEAEKVDNEVRTLAQMERIEARRLAAMPAPAIVVPSEPSPSRGAGRR